MTGQDRVARGGVRLGKAAAHQAQTDHADGQLLKVTLHVAHPLMASRMRPTLAVT